MRALILNILPQLMIVTGLAGMAIIVIRDGFPFRRTLQFDKIRMRVEAVKKIALERGMHMTEKTLRRAKILAMRLERFFSGRLETLVARKNGAPAKSSFWQNVRERKIVLRKAKTPHRSSAEPPSPGEEEEESVLIRFAKERDEKKEQLPPP